MSMSRRSTLKNWKFRFLKISSSACIDHLLSCSYDVSICQLDLVSSILLELLIVQKSPIFPRRCYLRGTNSLWDDCNYAEQDAGRDAGGLCNIESYPLTLDDPDSRGPGH